MKIEGGKGVGPAGGPRRAAGAAAPGFAPSADAPQRAAPASGVQALTALDAIVALQAEGGEGQRRARQARRGRDALDALDELVKDIALGRARPETKAELQRLTQQAENTGDERLDAILIEIDTRLAVELAKLEMAQGRA